jgi:hypothetical protein
MDLDGGIDYVDLAQYRDQLGSCEHDDEPLGSTEC